LLFASKRSLEDLTSQTSGLTASERHQVFSAGLSEHPEWTKKEHVANMILVFNSFFDYGYRDGES